jgi:hypothetical protein
VAALLAVGVALVVRNQVKVYRQRQAPGREATVRRQLFDELRPVALTTCRLERFGEPNDGGYLVCGNLLGDVKAGYSYGIAGYDQWGCDVATNLRVPVHEYDCFNTTVPQCPGGTTIFHAECVANAGKVEDGRPFDSIASQLARNGDGAHRLVVKIDVEGAEWASLHATPDDVLSRIDQLSVEFHGVRDESYLAVVRRLKRFFHVAHIHFNNFSCETGLDPFPSWAYEVLFVNRRLDRIDPSRAAGGLHPLDAPNNPALPDCPLKIP